jgi:hypothetical protein
MIQMSEYYLIRSKFLFNRWLRHALWGLIMGMLALSACKKNDTTPIEGTWIEATGRGDTLVFKNELIEVKRGFETQNGFRLPKAGSGAWSYTRGQDYQMQVRWLLSSNSATQAAHLELKDNLLYVSNFYESGNTKYELRAFNKQ